MRFGFPDVKDTKRFLDPERSERATTVVVVGVVVTLFEKMQALSIRNG